MIGFFQKPNLNLSEAQLFLWQFSNSQFGREWSQQLPLRLIEAVIPCSLSATLNSWLAYWLPRSL